MLENRDNPRYRTIAHGRIPGVMEGDNPLTNLSITGCCVECVALADIQPGSQYPLVIEPERGAHIGKFELSVECKWIRPESDSRAVGFSIVDFPKGKQFERYVDYLSYRSEHSSGGTDAAVK